MSFPFARFIRISVFSLLLPFCAGRLSAQFWPCQGTVSFSEDFEGGLPAGWLVWDFDSLNPSPQIPLAAGWTADTDFSDTSNTAMFSPSWYLPPGRSDDWLVTPQITLPSNPCLSWKMWSVDAFYPEAMQILISTTTADTNGFAANPLVVFATSIAGPHRYYAVNLGDYGGQSVRLAFRQVSNDRYAIGLDDIRITAVDSLDAAIVSMDSVHTLAFAATDVKGVLANLGSDTLRYAEIYYSVDGGPPSDTLIFDSLALGQNQTLGFTHPNKWTPDTTRLFNLCAFVRLPNHGIDMNMSNDTSCIGVNVVDAVGTEPEAGEALRYRIAPNPFSGRFVLSLDEPGTAQMALFSTEGKCVFSSGFRNSFVWEDESLPAGIYLLRIQTADGKSGFGKIIRY